MTGKLIDFAAFKAKKQAVSTGGSTALARAEKAGKLAKKAAPKRKRKAPVAKRERKKAQPRIKTSREMFVRCTKATPSRSDYKKVCGYLMVDRVDGEIVRVTFDPALADDLQSLDIDTDDTTYDRDKMVYTVRDIDDGCLWRFTRVKPG